MPSLTTLRDNYLAQFARTRTKQYADLPRARTVEAHRLQIERALHVLRDKPLDRLTVNDFKQLVLDTAARTGQSNVNQQLSALTGLIEYLRDERLFTADDLESWTRFKTKQYLPVRSDVRHKYLRPDEVTRLFMTIRSNPTAAQADRDTAFFGTLLLCPARVNALASVRLSDVTYRDDAPGPRFELLTDTKTHTAQLRFVFHAAALAGGVDGFAALANYHRWRLAIPPDRLRDATDGGAYWLNIKTRPDRPGYDQPNRATFLTVFKTAVERSGMPTVTTHWLRHTFGQATKHALSAREEQEVFGHGARRTMTEHYLKHDDPDRLRLLCLRSAEIISSNDW